MSFQFGCGFSPFSAKLMALSGANVLSEDKALSKKLYFRCH
ncbi:conserved hypothetical protein [Vibrio parahaemolyticus AN-5034]|nr:conserved hypothetical protein [Vibrio parahaemolyticus AN-5034]